MTNPDNQMSVRDLIAALQKMQQDKPAVVFDPVTCEYIDIQGIDAENSRVVIEVRI